MLVFDKFHSRRDELNGNCAVCTRYNTSPAWCQTCDPQITIQGWTSGNKEIDDCIKEFQLKATRYENAIEWIPFIKLNDIKKLGKGGFGTVFLANWQKNNSKSIKVALKTLPGSKTNSSDFLKEVS
jgi:serine/threonine protein kinase